ncbi:hypothetical protein NA57DRAFT_78068 [Rhizodiscina lignyota]|uniref:Uncharacterized protein n=1 Tax=Rhizodiscina lignyota TaxID=1504668 RepID=A0A9P4IBY8_9PEZI|nr:hypothetical protein NA57DRAFT_78068 [Rhizodiscina lignyota]
MSATAADETPERPAQRPRSKSGAFSLRSDKSVSSAGSPTKIKHGKETHEEKQRLHLSISGKANPNAAMNEEQPIAAALQASTIGSLRSVQHVDTFGNPIAEPDLSNPTRPRWERPLDTIRSFEAAIDGEYKRRNSATARPNTGMFSDSGVGYPSRRNSYFGADNLQQQPRYSRAGSQYAGQYGGYYGQNRDSYAENGNYGYGPPMAPPGQMKPNRRQNSEPVVTRYNNNGEALYPSPGYQRSRDTVNTGVSNGSQSEPWTNNTDPSSENSSIDRINAAPKQDPGEQYGFTGFGGAPFKRPIQEEMASYENGPGNGPNGGYFNHPPQGAQVLQPPPHSYTGNQQKPANKLISLNGENGGAPDVPGKDGVQVTARPALQSTPSQKKKSWLKRRFSKN